MSHNIVVGVLALQGAFVEHLHLLERAVAEGDLNAPSWTFRSVRTPEDLQICDALIIPGGESTTISLVAARSGLLEPLRDFVKSKCNPTWGTCAGLILLAESANRTKKGGQDLIGGLDVKVNRNHFGRQIESFEAVLTLPFLQSNTSESVSAAKTGGSGTPKFNGVFIRAPIVERILPVMQSDESVEDEHEDTVNAPSRSPQAPNYSAEPVTIMGTLPGRSTVVNGSTQENEQNDHVHDIVAVKQGNVFGTSFHPELTNDARIHVWWLNEVRNIIEDRSKCDR